MLNWYFIGSNTIKYQTNRLFEMWKNRIYKAVFRSSDVDDYMSNQVEGDWTYIWKRLAYEVEIVVGPLQYQRKFDTCNDLFT